MDNRRPTIFMSAAEASGDLHAAKLIHSIRKRFPESRFVGVAGSQMAEAGCEVLADLTKKASMLGGPLLRIGYYYRLVRRLQKQIAQIKPDIFIPVDSPALNWHLAAAAKKNDVPVMYYIAPQVWAWGPWRVKKVKRLTDHVACILPFEQRYFRDRGIKATYVGHPLFDDIPPRNRELPDIAEAWAEGRFNVALLPGSRESEIRGHIPALLQCAKEIRRRWNQSFFTITAHNDTAAEHIHKACKGNIPQYIDVVVGKTRYVLSQSHMAVVASGTVTLEVAYYGVPMVIFYRVEPVGYHLVKPFLGMTMPYLSLVNIIAGRRLVPELMPWHGRVKSLANMVIDFMQDYGCMYETRQQLLEIVSPLKVPYPLTASDNAAGIVENILLNNKKG